MVTARMRRRTEGLGADTDGWLTNITCVSPEGSAVTAGAASLSWMLQRNAEPSVVLRQCQMGGRARVRHALIAMA